MDKIVQPEDYRFIVKNPDPSFSPKRNKAIIQETITETEEYFRTINKAIDESLGDRVDMVGSYGVYRFNKGHKTFKDYLGKRLFSTLIGERILEKIRIAEEANKLGANQKFILT